MLDDRLAFGEPEPAGGEPAAPGSILDRFGPAFEMPEPEPGAAPPEPKYTRPEAADRMREPEPEPGVDHGAGSALIRVEDITTHEQAPELAQQLERYAVTSPETYAEAAELLKVGAAGLKVIDDFFDDNIAKAYATHKGLTTQKAKYYKPLREAVDTLKRRATDWYQAQERQRQEAQRRADEAARLERERVEREAREEAERLQREAQAKATTGDFVSAGELARQASTVIDQARNAPAFAPPVQSTAPATKGVSVKANWTYRITDMQAFVDAVSKGHIPIEAIQPNDSYLKGKAKVDKDTLRWPGVSFYDAGSMSVRSRR